MSLLPTKKNFTIWKGADFRHRLTFHDGPTEASPVKDLTSYEANLIIRARAGDAVPLLTLDTGVNGGITLGGEDGTIDILIDADDTATLTWKRGVYDLILIGPAANQTDAILYGIFVVTGV